MSKQTLLFILILSSKIFSQQYTLKGSVSDKSTLLPLSFASVQIAGTYSGTTTNREGNFELRLKPGNYFLTTTFIGYKSDTLKIELDGNKEVKFNLEPIPVRLSEIKVLPGENPALKIIRAAIEAKKERSKKLNSYAFSAYTKGIIKTTKDFSSSGGGINLSIGSKDTAKLKITGIIENESRGYFNKPGKYKDEIVARKQSANTPSSVNILTGGRIIQNFYTDDILFLGKQIPSPIADDAIDYYDYLIEDTLSINNQNVFQIHINPLRKSDPGFTGDIFITDKSYCLLKLDLDLNSPANPARLFDRVNVFQQFNRFGEDIYMPIDYRIFAYGNFLGIAKFGFELNTVFYDYKINEAIDDDIFGMAIVKVMPDADKKDSLYWKSTQTIANTIEEQNAYKRIDSLETVPKTFWDNFSFLSTTVNLSKYFSVTGPLSLYSFNRIEGHTLNFGIGFSQPEEKRFLVNSDFSYGFSDKILKADFSATYLLGEYRTTSVSFSANNKLTDLFRESIKFNKLTSTLTNLLGKYDFRDYYYTKGFSFKFLSEVFPILRIGAGILNRTDNSGNANSDYSILNMNKRYNVNPSICETKINAITAAIQIDSRKYIEDGYFRRRVGTNQLAAVLSGDAIFSLKNLLNSSMSFNLYRYTLNGYMPTVKSGGINLILSGVYSSGAVPMQMLFSLPGNIESASQSFTMRTLRTGEVFGDRALVLSIENNVNDELFRLLGLTFLCELQINLNFHFNAAVIEVSAESKNILPSFYNNNSHPLTEYKSPFYELGFGIGHPLVPFRIEFTWKLNYLGNENFFVGINTPVL